MKKKNYHVSGYILLPIKPDLPYRGMDRQLFEPLILIDDKELSNTNQPFQHIWELFPPGWRQDAYRIYEENTAPTPPHHHMFLYISILSNLHAAKEIQKIIEPHIGKHETIYCEVFKTGIKNTERSSIGGKIMGYDVAYPGGDYYSAIRNGLIDYPGTELEAKYKSLLNEFGLFSDIEIIIPYIKQFKKLVLSEADSDFVVYKLYLILE